MKRSLRPGMIAVCALLTCAAPAYGQGGLAPRDVTNETANRTYSADLGSLSRVMGGAHYIRRLCSGRADQRWRDQMRRFMDLEGPPGTPQRAVMVQEFNAGYRDQEEHFPACSQEAQAYEATLNKTGARLASALAARYRN